MSSKTQALSECRVALTAASNAEELLVVPFGSYVGYKLEEIITNLEEVIEELEE